MRLFLLSFAFFILSGCFSDAESDILDELENIADKVRPVVELMKDNLEPTPDLPPLPTVDNTSCAEQGWDKPAQDESDWKTRGWFWHIPQGTQMMPYEWFLALERPENEGDGLFRDDDYIMRFGFIPYSAIKNESCITKQYPNWNPDQLPIGFVKDDKFINPMTGKKRTMVGLTCAACHTAQINYQGQSLVIDGGPAMTNVTLFQDKLAIALAETLLNPLRFRRFAKQVLKEQYSFGNAIKLMDEVFQFAKESGTLPNYMINNHLNVVTEGFGRVDALTRIGNVVFGYEVELDNSRAISAPVSYPPIWTVPWFDWAQYNGSIRQPMVRNVGEALGVQALVNLKTEDKEQLFNSSVHVDNLYQIESFLAGTEPLSGLQAPKWPVNLFGPINEKLKNKGQKLYEQHCQKCHLPPIDSEAIKENQYWDGPNQYGKRYLITQNIEVEKIGTDPAEVFSFYARTAKTKQPLKQVLSKDQLFANDGLRIVTAAVANKWYDANGKSKEERIEMDGYRENKVLRPLKYRARPLNGVWATPPYLHNGSVPNLYELLSPWEERSKQFYVGSKEFDPGKVGLVNMNFTGAFLLDTTLPGNANTGHEFKDGSEGNGIIGPKLSEEERWALIEYLKSL